MKVPWMTTPSWWQSLVNCLAKSTLMASFVVKDLLIWRFLVSKFSEFRGKGGCCFECGPCLVPCGLRGSGLSRGRYIVQDCEIGNEALSASAPLCPVPLVGIAGEDDLDAPELIAPNEPVSDPEKPKKERISRTNDSRPAPRGAARRRNDAETVSVKQILGLAASAELRDRLLAELNTLASADDAAHWAHRSLRAKNDLTASDAEQVEVAFQTKLATFGDGLQEEVSATVQAAPKPLNDPHSPELTNRLRSRTIDKSVLAVPEPRRIRDRDYVKAVAKKPCLICGRQPSDAHHLRFAQARALGRKASDEHTSSVSGTSSRGSPSWR
jgi:hypothetical protein